MTQENAVVATDLIPRHIFVGGTARSGTTALTHLINANSGAILGNERYHARWGKGDITPDLFEKDRFLKWEADDTVRDPSVNMKAQGFAKRFGQHRLIGDKWPFIHAAFPKLDKHFPGAVVVFIVREPFSVCESFQKRHDDPNDVFGMDAAAGLKAWNGAMTAALKRLEVGKELVIVRYDRIFGSREAVTQLYQRLGLDPGQTNWTRVDTLIAESANLTNVSVPRRAGIRQLVAEKANFAPYRQLLRQAVPA